MASTIKRTICPECNKDNLNWFNNQHGKLTAKCRTAGCTYYPNKYNQPEPITSSYSKPTDTTYLLETGSYEALQDRGINKQTCEIYDYQTATYKGITCYLENHYSFTNKTKRAFQKIRLPSKEFPSLGDVNKAGFFGCQLYKDQPILYLTEGAIDAMTVYQCLNKDKVRHSTSDSDVNPLSICDNFLVCSLKGGAGDQTAQEIIKAKKWIDKFQQIYLALDNDDAGQEAWKQIKDLFPIGKLYKVNYRYKDANEYKLYDELLTDLNSAVQYVPDMIRKPTFEEVMAPDPFGWKLPFPMLNKNMRGIKKQRLSVILAGEKIGKSTFTKFLAKHLIDNNEDVRVGFVYLEEPLRSTAQSFIAMDNNLPLWMFAECPEAVPLEKRQLSYQKYVKSNKTHYIDAAFMSLQGKAIMNGIEYLVKVNDCNVIVLDHLSMITYDSQGENSERKDIDVLMKNLRVLVNDLNVHVLSVCHLSRPPKSGPSFAEGRSVDLQDARGSAAIGQLSDYVIGIERNMKDEFNRSRTKLSLLANRVTGMTGYMDEIVYLDNTGQYEVLKGSY